jgi:hypothetical protein
MLEVEDDEVSGALWEPKLTAELGDIPAAPRAVQELENGKGSV